MYDELTKVDIEKLQAELDHRMYELRPQLIEEVKVARGFGDLSENFEYKAAKREKNRNESRIRYLERLVRNATVVSDESAADEVGMNNAVEVYFPEEDMTETYKLVTSIRGNSLNHYISVESPLGKALMGHRAGDTVTVRVSPEICYDVEIRRIDKSLDDSEDSIRGF